MGVSSNTVVLLLFVIPLQNVKCSDFCDSHEIREPPDYGNISSVEFSDSISCQIWRIWGKPEDTITIRLSNITLEKAHCTLGANIMIGPVPYLDFCKMDNYTLPFVYRSEKNGVWIKADFGSEASWLLPRPTLALEYILSSSPRCSFKCGDQSCIDQHWVCNGLKECSKGEDEMNCSARISPNLVDYPPVAVIWPSNYVTVRLPVRSCVLYGNSSTDDHGIAHYEWRKFMSNSLSSDVVGSSSSILYLSNLEVGEYTISLTVSDEIGQKSTAFVRVVVQPEVLDAVPNTFAKTTLAPFVFNTTSWLVVNSTRVNTTKSARYTSRPECYACWMTSIGRYGCLPQSKLCDGAPDCYLGEDEMQHQCDLKHGKTTTLPPPDTTVQRKPTYSSSYCAKGEVYCYIISSFTQSCLQSSSVCDGKWDCFGREDESSSLCENIHKTTTESPQNAACAYNEIYCYVADKQRYMCLHNMYKCDGVSDCYESQDEDPVLCGNNACNRRLEDPQGWFASPKYPSYYPAYAHCSWVIHQQGSSPSSVIQLRVVFFDLENQHNTDYVEIYDGPDTTYKKIGTYYGSYAAPPHVIESTSNWMNIVFYSNGFEEHIGFNFTYQMKGDCLASQRHCDGENDCYDFTKDRCNGVWDCRKTGSDEIGCEHCDTDYSCGPDTKQCYHPSERCNGLARCSNSYDELNCTSVQCGTHNGTFLCDNRRCIYESWTCDQRDDCGDNSDESFCSDTSNRVIIAAICGSMICALLLVILVGCSCKLYYLRHIDYHRHMHHETPMSRLYAEFLRRRAPPPYHEAMLTSRNFDEVQREYLEHMRNSRRSRRNRRRSRNNQIEPQVDSVSDAQTLSTTLDETQTVGSGDSDSMQLLSLRDENQNLSPGDQNSDNYSETDSADESETDLGDDVQGHDQGRDQNRSDNSVSIELDADLNEEGDDSDDENILLASMNHDSVHVDADDSSDERCILADESLENLNPPDNMPKIESSHTTTSVISETNGDTSSSENVLDIEDENADECSDVVDSLPKPNTNRVTAVIREITNGGLRRNNSRGSLESGDYETCSENEVPLLAGRSSSPV